jgi:uncharacterized protein
MPIRILSIDGGGTRGLFPATLIHELEKELGKPVTEIFDVIIGSATGGIIASALAAGLSGKQIQNIYLTEAEQLLPKNFFRQFILLNPLNLFRAKYSNKGLLKALDKHIGSQKTLGDVFNTYGEKPVFLIPSLDLNPYLTATEIPGFKPVIFNSAYVRDQNEKLIDVAMRTSAAVVNLPIYQQYGEGGNYANDPCVFGLSFALNNHPDPDGISSLANNKLGLGKKPEEIKLLSLGCGSTAASYVPEKHLKNPDWGLLKWQRYLISLVIDSNMVANQYLTAEVLPKENYLRINAYYLDEHAPKVLQTKKLKIDVKDPVQLKAIKEYAETTYASNKSSILSFLQTP